jgi:hypothetical protein
MLRTLVVVVVVVATLSTRNKIAAALALAKMLPFLRF